MKACHFLSLIVLARKHNSCFKLSSEFMKIVTQLSEDSNTTPNFWHKNYIPLI